jgi:hypothetical protein
MTHTDTHPTTTDRARTRHGVDHSICVLATGLAGLIWLVWRATGSELAIRSGHETHQVGLVSALVTAAVVSVAGLGLLRFLERRSPRGLRTWTIVACAVWLVSLLGPLGAADPMSGVALTSLHLVVGATVVLGAWFSRRHGVA